MERKAGLFVLDFGALAALLGLFLELGLDGAALLTEVEFDLFGALRGEELPVALFFFADLRTAFLAAPAAFFTVFLLDDFLLPEAI